MENKRRWLSYDTFKLIVALILLVIFILLMLRPAPLATSGAKMPPYPAAGFQWNFDAGSRSLLDPQGNALFTLSADGSAWQPVIPADIRSSLPEGFQLVQGAAGSWVINGPDGKALFAWDMSLFRWVPVAPVAAMPQVSATPLPPTATLPPPTATPEAQPTATPEAQPTAAPEAQPTPTQEAQPTPKPETAPAAASCSAAAPSRLEVGKNARVLSNLNLRSAPAIGNNLVKVNPVGTQLKVLAGPQCVPFQNGAYLWWQVEGPDGTQGWSAEATLGGAYFLAPVP